MFIALGKGLVVFLFSQPQLTFLLYEGNLTNCIYTLNDYNVLRLISSDNTHLLNASSPIHNFHLPRWLQWRSGVERVNSKGEPSNGVESMEIGADFVVETNFLKP